MLIYTLWKREDDNDSPWLVAAVDEYAVEENGFPDEYSKARSLPDHRELIVSVPDSAVWTLFEAPTIKATIVAPERDQS